MGACVVGALGIGTSATHMEWFYGPKGLRFSEIGCRPSGGGAWGLSAAGTDMDIDRGRGDAVVPGSADARPSRAYAAGMIALRPTADGLITGYSGLDAME